MNTHCETEILTEEMVMHIFVMHILENKLTHSQIIRDRYHMMVTYQTKQNRNNGSVY